MGNRGRKWEKKKKVSDLKKKKIKRWLRSKMERGAGPEQVSEKIRANVS